MFCRDSNDLHWRTWSSVENSGLHYRMEQCSSPVFPNIHFSTCIRGLHVSAMSLVLANGYDWKLGCYFRDRTFNCQSEIILHLFLLWELTKSWRVELESLSEHAMEIKPWNLWWPCNKLHVNFVLSHWDFLIICHCNITSLTLTSTDGKETEQTEGRLVRSLLQASSKKESEVGSRNWKCEGREIKEQLSRKKNQLVEKKKGLKYDSRDSSLENWKEDALKRQV